MTKATLNLPARYVTPISSLLVLANSAIFYLIEMLSHEIFLSHIVSFTGKCLPITWSVFIYCRVQQRAPLGSQFCFSSHKERERERERERETLDFPERISIPREFAVDVKIVIKRNDNDRGPPRGRSLAESFRFEPNKTALNEFSLALGSPFSSLVFSSFYPWRISRLINI